MYASQGKSFDPFPFPDPHPHRRQSSVGKARKEEDKKREEGTWHELLVTTHFFAALPLGCSHVTSQVLFSGGGGFAVK